MPSRASRKALRTARVAVVGGGPAGLTAAWCLARGGVAVDVFESAEQVGGLGRSLDLWGWRLDLGPHRFWSTDARVGRAWLAVVGSDYKMVDRITRIRFRGKFFNYPLEPVDALTRLGAVEAVHSAASWVRARARAHTSQSRHLRAGRA